MADVILRMTWFRGNDREGENNQLFLILASWRHFRPLVATMIQLAISRQRE